MFGVGHGLDPYLNPESRCKGVLPAAEFREGFYVFYLQIELLRPFVLFIPVQTSKRLQIPITNQSRDTMTDRIGIRALHAIPIEILYAEAVPRHRQQLPAPGDGLLRGCEKAIRFTIQMEKLSVQLVDFLVKGPCNLQDRLD